MVQFLFFFKTRYELKQKTNLTNPACDEILKVDIYSMIIPLSLPNGRGINFHGVFWSYHLTFSDDFH